MHPLNVFASLLSDLSSDCELRKRLDPVPCHKGAGVMRNRHPRTSSGVILALVLSLAVSSAVYAQTPSQGVFTYHNDLARTGQNLNETILSPSNVNSASFGKLFANPVDGQVYAQPLYVANVVIPNQGIHNVVYVATENNTVYAFDADTHGAPLWQTSLSINGGTAVPSSDVNCPDVVPVIGVTGTPVIDPTTNTLYVVAKTKEGPSYFQRLHALDIATGAEKFGGPVAIEATVSGTGDGSNGTTITFDPFQQLNRPGLALVNGVVYIAWGAFGDTDFYHGWVIGYTYNGAAFQKVGVFNSTPDGQEGGIWMSGAGPAADAQGNIYLTIGNGSFDLDQTGQRDAGDSFVKLSTRNGLVLSDYFTPFNQECLDGRDEDLGAGGVLLLPEQPHTAHPRLLIGVGKEGRIYVLDRDQLGQFHGYSGTLQCSSKEESRTNIDQVVQELPASSTGGFFGIPGYWVGTAASGHLIYIGEAGDHLKSFQLIGGTLSSRATAQTPETFAFPGVTPSISSNKSAPGTGIVWVISPASCGGPGCAPSGPGALRAYNATNISQELYNSEQNFTRDRLDSYVKFSVPTIANGKVFVGTQTSLNIYGLLTS